MANWWFNISKILLLITTPFVLNGQEVLFNKTEDFTPQWETFWGQVQATSGEMVNIVAKASAVLGMEYDSTLLVSYDEYGCEIWSTSYYFHETFIERVLMENIVKENYSAVAIYLDDNVVDPSYMIGIIEFSYDGNFLSFTTQGWEATNDSPLRAKVLPDGGLIIVGRRTLGIGYGPRGFVIRTDVEGNLLWDFTYGEVDQEDISSVFTDVVLGPDGNFWITANTTIEEPGTIMLKLDDNGNIVEEQENLFPLYMESTGVNQKRIIFVNDSTYLIASTGDKNNSVDHTVLASFTINGELNWFYYAEPFFQVQQDRTEDMQVLPNGDIVLCGWEREIENDFPLFVGWVKKFSPDGDLLWDINYVPEDDSGLELYDTKLMDLDLMDDGTLWVGGSANYIPPGAPTANTKLWMMRIDTSGNFITNLSASLIQENEVFCFGAPVSVTLDLSSSNGCYETEWLVNDSIIISDNKDSLFFQPMASGTYEVVCNLVDDTGQNLSILKQIEVDYLSPLTLPSTDTIATEEILDIGEIPYFDETEWMGTAAQYLYEENGQLYFANAPLGDYELTLNGDCLDQQSMTIVVDTETSLPTIESILVNVYPNPATTSVTFSFPALNKESILQIYDGFGRLVAEAALEKGRSQKVLEVATFVDGLYYWKLGEWESGKFVKD